MRILFPFIFSFLIGGGLLSLLQKKVNFFKHPYFCRWIVAMALGLGISAQLVFYSLLIKNQLSSDVVMRMHFVLIFFILIFLGVFLFLKDAVFDYIPGAIVSFYIFSFWISISLSVFRANPFGGWDSWALWNFRANFIFRAAEEWMRIFQFEPLARHPWGYSFLIDWGWVNAGENQWTMYVLTLIFFVSLTSLLFFTLVKEKGLLLGFTGVFWLLFPAWFLQAFQMYADLEVSFYLLLTIIQGQMYLKDRSSAHLFLCVIFCAFLSFFKNEGLFLSVLFMLNFIRFIPIQLRLRAVLIYVIFFLPTLFSEILMLNPSHGINVFVPGNLFIWSRWVEVLSAVSANFLSVKSWSLAWGATVILLILNKPFFKNKYLNSIKLLIGCFLLIAIVQYVGYNNDVRWRVNVTFLRELFILWPVVCFLVLYQIDPFKKAKEPS
jgi:hypothetical protein